MSTVYNKEVTCGLCGETVAVTLIGSINAMGYMDLDTRPPEMKRSTMPLWTSECPYCGYVAKNLAEDGRYAADFVKSKEYTSDKEIISHSKLADKFVKWAKLLHLQGQGYAEMQAYLNAAWAFDDDKDNKNAVICRLRGVEALFNKANERGTEKLTEDFVITSVDMLRRARHFDAVLDTDDVFEIDMLKGILAYEKELARAKDDKCHSICEVKSLYNKPGQDEDKTKKHEEDDDITENDFYVYIPYEKEKNEQKRSKKLIDFLMENKKE